MAVMDCRSSYWTLAFLGGYHKYWPIAGFKQAFMTRRSSRIVDLKPPNPPRISDAAEGGKD